MSSALYYAAGLAGSALVLPAFFLSPRGRRNIWERYGNWHLEANGVIWFHGASAGEIAGVIPLIKKVRDAYPSQRVLVTATSTAGLERARPLADFVKLLPFDNPLWIKRALKEVSCKAFIFGETEIWPALVKELAAREVPLFLVNGRLSEFSFNHYRLIKPWLRRTLGRLSLICAANQKYRDRFIGFGADAARVLVTGNAKYDSVPSVRSPEEAQRIKTSFFSEDLPVLTLGSLRPGEEAVWFPAMADAQKRGLLFKAVVAPRHMEKCDYFEAKLNSCGLKFTRRSAMNGLSSSIVLLDSFGQLEPVYAFADAAFIGGSLVPGFGGHNPLEAAAYGTCVALGPYCENIDDIVEQLKEKDAFVPLCNQNDAASLLERLCLRDPGLQLKGRLGREVWQANSGAGDRILQAIKAVLDGQNPS